MTEPTDDAPIFGEPGRRKAAIQWGVKHPALRGVWVAGVELCADESHARDMVGSFGASAFVVCRTVVTYTAAWAPSAAGGAR